MEEKEKIENAELQATKTSDFTVSHEPLAPVIEKKGWKKYALLLFLIPALVVAFGIMLLTQKNTGSPPVISPTSDSTEFKIFGDVIKTNEGEYSIGQGELSGIEKEIAVSDDVSTFSYKYKFDGNASQDLVFVNSHGKEYNSFYTSEYRADDGFYQQIIHLGDPLFFEVQCEEFPDLCEPPFKLKIVIRSVRPGYSIPIDNPGKLIIKDIQFYSMYDELAEEIIRSDFLSRKKLLPVQACDVLFTPSLRDECKSRAPKEDLSITSNKSEATDLICENIKIEPNMISLEKDECYFESASKSNNPDLCSKVENSILKNYCIASIVR